MREALAALLEDCPARAPAALAEELEAEVSPLLEVLRLLERAALFEEVVWAAVPVSPEVERAGVTLLEGAVEAVPDADVAAEEEALPEVPVVTVLLAGVPEEAEVLLLEPAEVLLLELVEVLRLGVAEVLLLEAEEVPVDVLRRTWVSGAVLLDALDEVLLLALAEELEAELLEALAEVLGVADLRAALDDALEAELLEALDEELREALDEELREALADLFCEELAEVVVALRLA